MNTRTLPVRPDLGQLKRQAKELLRDARAGDPTAATLIDPATAKLADAQHAIANSYGAKTWARLVQACDLIDAIWRDDISTVRRLMRINPKLLHEPARVVQSNWGAPMSYAANLGRDEIIKMLYDMGATDLEYAIGRAVLQGKIETARMLYEWMGSPVPPAGALGGPAYTLSVEGTKFLLDQGVRLVDDEGKSLAPVAVVLESDSRKPEAKHRILEMYTEGGVKLPDTPVMALHRGRIDLLEKHLKNDPELLGKTFSHEEIYPPEWGCRAAVETQGTPLDGTTLLHMSIDFDERQVAEWLFSNGADANVPSRVDESGFGGFTPLFGAVVCYANFWGNWWKNETDSWSARLLLSHGADPNRRASIRKTHDLSDQVIREYVEVTPLSYGDQFHDRMLVSKTAMKLIEGAGGGR